MKYSTNVIFKCVFLVSLYCVTSIVLAKADIDCSDEKVEEKISLAKQSLDKGSALFLDVAEQKGWKAHGEAVNEFIKAIDEASFALKCDEDNDFLQKIIEDARKNISFVREIQSTKQLLRIEFCLKKNGPIKKCIKIFRTLMTVYPMHSEQVQDKATALLDKYYKSIYIKSNFIDFMNEMTPVYKILKVELPKKMADDELLFEKEETNCCNGQKNFINKIFAGIDTIFGDLGPDNVVLKVNNILSYFINEYSGLEKIKRVVDIELYYKNGDDGYNPNTMDDGEIGGDTIGVTLGFSINFNKWTD